MNPHFDLQPVRNERGIALISALLVVMLVAVVAAGFILMASGERSVSSNVQIARASLLSADAGVRVAQQALANQAKAKLDSLTTVWAGTGPIITSPATLFSTAAQSFNSAHPGFTATATISFADSQLTPNAQTFNYRYVITSIGTAGAQGQRQVQSTGILRVSAERGEFADYLLLTDVHLSPVVNNPVWFTSSSRFDGRVHTNGEFRFAFQPFFQDLVTSVNPKAIFYNNGSPQEVNASSYGTTDVPLFYGGFDRGVAAIPLPTNTYDPQSRALGLAPNGFQPSNAAINTALGLGAGMLPPPDSIYVLHQGALMTGGIYVQGPLDHCVMTADTVTSVQTFVMTQGGVTRTIAVDRSANTTVVTTGGVSQTFTGLPNGVIYVNQGTIGDLRGPDRVGGLVVPAVARGQQLMICATGDIVLRRDLVCDDFADATNVLGIYSGAGDVVVGTDAPDDFALDAFVMATGPAGAFRVENYGSGGLRGAFRLRGGVVERYFGEFYTADPATGNLLTGYARDFHYDRRGLVPPQYPKTNRFNPNQPTARTLAWKEI